MREVFADTAFYAAILNRRDEYHAAARAVAATLTDRIVTTEFVFLETANFCSQGARRKSFAQLLANLRAAASVTILAATADLFQRGLELFESRLDKTWSLTDCISFTVMRDRGINEALTTDGQFTQAGFKVLLSKS